MNDAACDARGELRFFGRVSASISHEIKNVLAVVNEAAGLIDDFTRLAQQGAPLDPEKLQKAAGAIQEQVRRGDAIVKNMNAFAHSSDAPSRDVDLVEALTLAVALAGRRADMRQVKLAVGDCVPVSMRTGHFDLLRLLHSSIAAVLDRLEAGDSLSVGVCPASAGAVFSLSVPGKVAAPADEGDLEGALASALEAVKADLRMNEQTGVCELRVYAQ